MANSYSNNWQAPTPDAGDPSWNDENDLYHYMAEFIGVAQASENRVISGLLVTDGGGLDADFTEGVADVGGTRHTVPASSITLTANAENFLYINSSGEVAKSIVLLGAVDYVPIARVDTDGSSIVRIALCRVFGNPSLQLENGVEVDEFSSDGTMAGNSDLACPTEKAVVQYVQENINRENLLDNGQMLIAQRAAYYTGATSTGYHALDRYKTILNTAGTWDLSQSGGAPAGQQLSYKIDCTVTNASLSASSYFRIRQSIEGRNLASLRKGLSSAKKLQLSFWVYSTKTGNFVVNINDTDNSRSVAALYTVSVANTWEYKEIEFPADTTGLLTYDSGESLNVDFWLAAGTDFTSGTLATSWESTTGVNLAVGQNNMADSTSNVIYFSGLSLTAGDYLPLNYQYQSYDEALWDCQRCFINYGSTYFCRIAIAGASNDAAMSMFHRPFMRDTPTLTTGTLNFGSGLTTVQNTYRQLRLKCTATHATNEPYLSSIALSADM